MRKASRIYGIARDNISTARIKSFSILLAILSVCFTVGAQLPNVSYTESAEALDQYGDVVGGFTFFPGPGTLNEPDGSGDTAYDIITPGNDPYVYSTATDVGGVYETIAAANFTYYFVVSVPGGGNAGTVPVWVTADLGATAGSEGGQPNMPPGAGASIQVDLPDGSGGVIYGSCVNPGPYNAIHQEGFASVNTVYAVRLSTYASGYASFFSPSERSGGAAYVDPEISIDATFAATNPGVSLVFSPDVLGPVQPVVSSPLISNGRFQMAVTGISNQTYTVQVTTNVAPGHWVSLLATNPPDGSFLFTDSRPSSRQGFYRAIVAPTPIVQFTASPIAGAPPLAVQFSCPGVDSAGNNLSAWQWNFGDGTTSTLQNPSHLYQVAGTFSPTLAVTNAIGGTVISSGPDIRVTVPPVVQFTASPTNGASPLAVQFICPGVDSAGNTLTAWQWNFGDGATSTLHDPSHTYLTNGTFSPTLIATNANGVTVIGSGPAIGVTNPVVPNVWTFGDSGSVTFIPSSSFDDNPVVPNFRYYYGSANSSAAFQWSSQEANGNPGSGSVQISMTMNENLDTSSTKAAFVIDLAGGSGINATNLSFDLMIDPESATDEYGGYGDLGIATLTGQWGTFNGVWDGPTLEPNYEFGTSWGIPYTAGTWYHFSIPLTGSAGVGINAINIQDYDGGTKDINGTITFYIGNLTLTGAPGGN